jgi:hypothetical protein
MVVRNAPVHTSLSCTGESCVKASLAKGFLQALQLSLEVPGL